MLSTSRPTLRRGCRPSIDVVREKTRTTTDGADKTSVTESVVKLKVVDKIRALELLGRHLGMFRDKVEHGGEVSLLDVCRRIEAEEDAAKRSTGA